MSKETSPLTPAGARRSDRVYYPSPARLSQIVGAAATLLAALPQARGEFDAERYLIYGFGQLSLRPRLEITEVYDSNLYYTTTDRLDDLITYVRPGFSLLYGQLEEDFVSISYATDISRHVNEGNLDYIGHIINHQSRLKMARTTFQAQDSYTENRSTLGGSFSYIRQPVGVSTLSDDWKIDYDISPKMMVGGEVQFNWVDYDAADLTKFHLYDFMSVSGSGRVGYMPSEKFVIYPQFTYTQSYLEKNLSSAPAAPNLSALSFSVGAQGEFTPKITGLISGGYEIREYDDHSHVPDGWIANMELRWQARPKTSVGLGFRHMIQVSRDSRGVAYTIDRPSVTLAQQLGTQGRWTVSLDAYYQLEDYNAEYTDVNGSVLRHNDVAGVSVHSSYRWTAWLTTVAGYDFSTYSDNLTNTPDYEVHRFTLRITAGY